jgi:nitrite reductase (NO-forming)
MDDFSDSLDAMRKLIPTHVVFSGKAGALTRDNAQTASVGESVLLIHAQTNRDSHPHLIWVVSRMWWKFEGGVISG